MNVLAWLRRAFSFGCGSLMIVLAVAVAGDAFALFAMRPHWVSPGIVRTYAGKAYAGHWGYPPCQPVDGVATKGVLCQPEGLAYDPADGSLYVGDVSGRTIRRVDRSGRISTFSGRYYPAGERCLSIDGASQVARFCEPSALALDPRDHALYVVDHDAIRRVDRSGRVSRITGQAQTTYSWNCSAGPDRQPPVRVCHPRGIALDPSDGSLWVTDDSSILRVSRDRRVTRVAGSPAAVDQQDCKPKDGIGDAAIICYPVGIAYDPFDDRMYFTDYAQLIRSVDRHGDVQTFAGTRYPPSMVSETDTAFTGCRDWDGWRLLSAFCAPESIIFDDKGDMYIADGGNEQIRRIDKRGFASSVAGHYYVYGTLGYFLSCHGIDGEGEASKFCYPSGLAFNAKEDILLVSERRSGQIREVRLGRP